MGVGELVFGRDVRANSWRSNALLYAPLSLVLHVQNVCLIRQGIGCSVVLITPSHCHFPSSSDQHQLVLVTFNCQSFCYVQNRIQI